ncbi:MAG: hypothetical protein ACXVY8_07350, partial [Gaiellaceae bacterium]
TQMPAPSVTLHRPGLVVGFWVAFIAVLFIMPITPTGVPGNSGFTWLSFNYAPIAVVGTLVLVGGWWLLSARKWFKGPVVQGTAEELERIEAGYGEPVAQPAAVEAPAT